MSTTLFSDIEPLIDEMVDKEVKPLFEEDTNFYMDFMKGEGEMVNGRGFKFKAYATPNESINFFSEAGAYAVPGKEGFFEMRVYPTRSSKGIEISGDVMNTWKTTTQALNGVGDELKTAVTFYKKQLQRYLFGDGTGSLGVIATGGVSGATITFATTYADGWTKGATFLTERQRVNWYTAAGVQRSGGAITLSTVSSFTSASVAVFDQVPSDLAATDYVVPENSHNKAFHGLKHLISNSNTMLQGVLRSSQPKLKSQEINAGGALISAALLSKTKTGHKYLASRDARNMRLVSAPSQKYQYERAAYPLIRIQQGQKFTGDVTDVGHLGSEWIECVDCDEDRIYGYEKGDIRRFELMSFGFYDYGDGRWFRKGSGGSNSDASTSWLGLKMELGTTNPQGMFVIKNLSITDAPTATGVRQY